MEKQTVGWSLGNAYIYREQRGNEHMGAEERQFRKERNQQERNKGLEKGVGYANHQKQGIKTA